jgi:hypothetical protein
VGGPFLEREEERGSHVSMTHPRAVPMKVNVKVRIDGIVPAAGMGAPGGSFVFVLSHSITIYRNTSRPYVNRVAHRGKFARPPVLRRGSGAAGAAESITGPCSGSRILLASHDSIHGPTGLGRVDGIHIAADLE